MAQVEKRPEAPQEPARLLGFGGWVLVVFVVALALVVLAGFSCLRVSSPSFKGLHSEASAAVATARSFPRAFTR